MRGMAQGRRAAPNFTRLDLHHRKIELSAFRRKVVLLNFWATWCGPCLAEMPIFAAWQRRYGTEGFQVIAVSMDDSARPVIAAVFRMKLNYPVVMGDARLGAAYGGVLGLPLTFLIDREGALRARFQGSSLSRIQGEMQRLLQSR
jgi:cytochrome c biogenesis protein CcmG/thiol:disulfide interchange protein DsbE